ncbi:MAG TPA: leucyl aminopeptidase [Vicinamibacterales bacterium]|nr:leucyl aminopeptidase [Vicinamibacterales bacterium]
MQKVHRTPAFALTVQPTHEIDTELLIIPFFEEDDLGDEAGLDSASGGELGRARDRRELTGKLYETHTTTLAFPGARMRRAVLVGAGPRAKFASDRLRRVAATGGLVARQRRVMSVALIHRPGTPVSAAEAAQAMAEGLTLSNFEGARYKTDELPTVFLDAAVLRVPESSPDVERALERGRLLGECSNLAKELANEPGNRLTPRLFAERAAELARAAGLGVEVLDEQRIAQLRMGLLLGVASGSQEPPRVVVLRHEPKGSGSSGPVLGLVGKGITFDTGGISIKPAENMDKMKDDMSGGAAVIGAMIAIARMGLPVRCLGVVPMTENMPGGRAVKPGDVLTSAEGKTVEILNTDAEGRLVLGDALWYARQLGATHLVDVATLTGACVVALGKTTSGLFGTPDAWVEQVRKASVRAGDRSWPMPVFDDYKELFKSEIADFSNTGGRPAGAITGALFVKEFSGNLPWVHMDIAGTAWAEESKPYQPKGATGVAVRTLAELALAASEWKDLTPEP